MEQLRFNDRVIWRFSLYGFLKNQQYYEPFFLLVLRAKGLSFFEIGLLYSFREVCINIMAIPAGFFADLYGRRTSLLVCFLAYIVSFLGFAYGHGLAVIFPTMFAFAVGESFRSGTHKAMIFHYLHLIGRENQKTAIYGYTRFWSKTGSALSSLISGALVFLSGGYEQIFAFTIAPYFLNGLNVATYPAVLEGEELHSRRNLHELLRTMFRETWACVKSPELRALFIESAALQSIAKTVRDYVQPLVVAVLGGFALGPLVHVDKTRRSAFLLGALYFVLNGVAATSARNAHRFDQLDRRRFPWLWCAVGSVGILLMVGNVMRTALVGATWIAIAGFVILVLLENVWRPLFLDRLDDVSDSRYGAAVLSVEAQFSSLGVMVMAPLVGKIADHSGLTGVGMMVALVACVPALVSYQRKRRSLERQGALPLHQ